MKSIRLGEYSLCRIVFGYLRNCSFLARPAAELFEIIAALIPE
jgi:hypothetical protein